MAVRYGFRRFGDDDDFGDLDADELFACWPTTSWRTAISTRRWTDCCARDFNDADGNRIEGLRELLERARDKRRELEQQADPDGEMQRYRDWLEDIEETEGRELDELLAEARGVR